MPRPDRTRQLSEALADLTGADMDAVVADALRARLAKGREQRVQSADLPARLHSLARRLRVSYDTSPVTRAEWNAATGDEA